MTLVASRPLSNTVQGARGLRDSIFATVPKPNGPEVGRPARHECHRVVGGGRHLAGDVVALVEARGYDAVQDEHRRRRYQGERLVSGYEGGVRLEAAAVPSAELGAFLRRRGVLEAQLVEWRKQITDAAVASMRPPSRSEREAAAAESKKIRQLERELLRKDKALAETAALLVLKKKTRQLGDEDDDTDPKSDK
ncbi:MAG: hypothetical protein ABJE66_36410 [Deltaproteobacteria bacterium]